MPQRGVDRRNGLVLTMLNRFALLERVEKKYGSIDAYLERKCGIGEEERAALREQLTC